MTIDKLREHLAQLNEAIDRLDPADSASLERMRQLAQDIESEIGEEKTKGDPAALVSDIEAAVSGFEASHPNLTAILNNMLVVLGGIGV